MHKKHAEKEAEVNLAIIITPFLDMAFQLLAFFIMTYHPSALEGHIDGSLLPPNKVAIKGPKTGNEKKDDEIITDTPPDPKTTITVVVKAVPRGQTKGELTEGTPTRISLRLPEGGGAETVVADAETDPRLTFDGALKKLQVALKKAQDVPGGGKTDASIEAHRDLRHGYFIRIYDACKAAKFNSIGFVPPLPEGAGGG